MKDVNGKPIEVGQKLKRVIDGRGTDKGHEYKVVSYDFHGNGQDYLVADGMYVKELLDGRSEEFEIVEA